MPVPTRNVIPTWEELDPAAASLRGALHEAETIRLWLYKIDREEVKMDSSAAWYLVDFAEGLRLAGENLIRWAAEIRQDTHALWAELEARDE